MATALRQGYTIEHLFDLTHIDRWFLHKFASIIQFTNNLSNPSIIQNQSMLLEAKRLGFSDKQIALYCGSTEFEVFASRERYNIRPCVKQIDTISGEWLAQTNYLYVTYHGSSNDVQPSKTGNKSILVLGCGAYRIGKYIIYNYLYLCFVDSLGSSVEFDWCVVGCLTELRRLKHFTISEYYAISEPFFFHFVVLQCLTAIQKRLVPIVI